MAYEGSTRGTKNDGVKQGHKGACVACINIIFWHQEWFKVQRPASVKVPGGAVM
jgi:hypothetical protein